MNDPLIRKTKYGLVKGTSNEYCDVFLNIPFAKPPLGDLRFKHPVEPDKWEGVLDASKGGPNPIQQDGQFSVPNQSLDCLQINFFIPKGEKGPLPVMFWIYGGAYSNGGVGVFEEDKLYYDMSLFAEETKTVVVTFNYRVGVYGFLNLHSFDESCDLNNGLMDQLMALKFTKENVEYFNGDKNNITIFGQSAGGASVMSLMSMEETKGLYNKAISESPCIDHFFTIEESEKLTKKFLHFAKIKDVKDIYTLSEKTIKKASQKVCDWFLFSGDERCFFSPIIDEKILKGYPMSQINNSSVPLLMGYTSNESDLFMDRYPAILFPYISKQMGVKAKRGKDSLRHRFSDAITEYVYINPINKCLDGYKSTSYLYEFAYAVPPKRAYHASEVILMVVEKDDHGAKEIRKIFSNFAYKGNPGWHKHEPGSPAFVIK